MIKKLCSLVDRFEKIANFPDVPTITNIITTILDSQKSNSLLAGARTKPDQVSVSTNIDNKSAVYFQVVFEKNYEMAQQNRTQIQQLLAPLLTAKLAATFRQYDFNVTVGVVPL